MYPKVTQRTNRSEHSSRFQLNSIRKGQWKYNFDWTVFLLLNGVLDFIAPLVTSHILSLVDRS